MLAARRDPVFDRDPALGNGSADPSLPTRPAAGPTPPAATPAFTRFIAGVQILGTVLAIPLGLASGYSIYRSNFSPEAKCGSLRANIISMLDKNADATTLRLLVRRDVATFEHSCAAVDPDAVAAFKTLLAKPAAVASAPKGDKTVRAVKEAKAIKPAKVDKKLEKKVEKRAEKKVAHAATAVRVAHAKADADWLAAVRRALVEHGPVTRAVAAEAPAPVAPPMTQPMAKPMGAVLPAPAAAQAAPRLPPATAVANAPAPKSPTTTPALGNDESHPVPPALIPDVGPQPAK
ncbi:MAG: hypothetical protein P8Z80_07410 [Pseudolabrys sp.]